MKILALDTGTRTGWAIIDGGRVFESGVQDFSKRRGESNGAMFLRFRAWLADMLYMQGHIKFVCYEQAHHRGGAATEICVNLTGRVQEECAARCIEFVGIHTATLKKWACGSGRADKTDMTTAAIKRLGRVPIDDNEADAVLLGLMAWEEYGSKSE
jgi:Holliday junction resolvasome RuvABC endonuclease subunit